MSFSKAVDRRVEDRWEDSDWLWGRRLWEAVWRWSREWCVGSRGVVEALVMDCGKVNGASTKISPIVILTRDLGCESLKETELCLK